MILTLEVPPHNENTKDQTRSFIERIERLLEEDLSINPFKQDASRRSSLKSNDEEQPTPPLEQANETSSSILQDLKAYLDKKDEDLKVYLSQELAIREDLMEEKLQSLIDPKKSTQKTERQAQDDDFPPASEEDDPDQWTDFFEHQLWTEPTTKTYLLLRMSRCIRGSNAPLEGGDQRISVW